MDLNQSLSPHFLLKELVVTSHRELDNTPTPEIVANLAVLSVNYLEPIRDKFGPLHVNSGYRSPAVNTAIGGSTSSAHMKGQAADFVPFTKGLKLQTIVDWIIEESGMPFDQVILESSSTADWVHLGLSIGKQPRKEALRFKNGVYSKYLKETNYNV